jgi:hypothetical protein
MIRLLMAGLLLVSVNTLAATQVTYDDFKMVTSLRLRSSTRTLMI